MHKLLVANRGEIALRIMRTARQMGIATVAIYSDADRDAPHVNYADEAIRVGPSPASQSYLSIEAVLAAATRVSADAIHPGYGFLSERAAFARAVRDAGLTFVGPSPEAMDQMGSKLDAKVAVKAFGVPLVPGLDEPIDDETEALRVADAIGYPVLVKASAGGGGKGMRVVLARETLVEDMRLAQSEALSAFGDGRVFIEKYVSAPRHIEVQVFADRHGNVVHLFERECSVQRRHQKVLEEAPSAVLTPDLRARMGASAVAVAKACAYEGAGTVEFLLDADLNYYFLEMNTRLQVEHPVTEWTTGLDLVEWQLRVARGEPLGFRQNELRQRGHAIELRVYAEDPANDFLPDIGTLSVYKEPSGPNIRVDSGYVEGMTVPIYYDPMLSKLIAYGETRAEAIEQLKSAIDNYRIEGVATTLEFGRFVLGHEAFVSGKFDTSFVPRYWTGQAPAATEDGAIAQIAKLLFEQELDKVRV